MDLKQMKKMAAIFLACAAGAIAVQLMAPIILAIFVNVASLMIPFMGYYLFVQKHWRVRFEKVEEEETPPEKEKKETAKRETAATKATNVLNDEEEIREDGNCDEGTYAWFQEKGKERIDRMVNSLYTKGIFECWIRQDGICNVRGFKGFRRVEILPGYPGNDADTVAELIKESGLQAENQGRHLHILWPEE